MQTSSPLAALQPRPFITTTFGMSPYSRPRARPNALGSRMGGSRQTRESGFFDPDAPVADSSPTTSLVADLSQNFHIDKTPRVATPRRSLFTNFTFVSRGMPSSPLMGAADANEMVDEMDLCSLPHKSSYISPIREEPLISPHTEYLDSPMRSSPPPEDIEPADELPAAPQVPGAPSKRAVLLERRKSGPSRQPFRHKSNNVLFKHTAPTSSISFAKGSKGALDLGEMFGPSPPQKDRQTLGTGFNPAVIAPPTKPKFVTKDTSALSGSPVAPINRKPPPRPKLKIRRAMSMYENPQEIMAPDAKKSKPLSAPLESPSKIGEPQQILPCFQVKDDPLHRIKRATLLDVLDDKYKEHYDTRIIVDCRFEYEFDGGHVAGAINVNTLDALEERFFKNPIAGKTLLIFHCEYSAHRAPRMASQFRSLDRQMNMHRYPALSYPDVYILEGGYSGFYREHSNRCEPQQYIEMKDVLHRSACEREMGKFRRSAKLGRAQSYTFGVHKDSVDASPVASNPRRNNVGTIREEECPSAEKRQKPEQRRVATY